MFGLSFLNGVFLAGLLTAAIPVIIHLLNRRRSRRIQFSSLEFLDEVSRRRMRRINLRRIIMLALRTLAVILIVAAFARPTLRGAGFFPGRAARNIVICLDASYSMGLEREQGTAFTRAKALAADVVRESGKNDEINVVVFSDQAMAMFDRGTRNKALVASGIDKAELSSGTTSIRRGIDRAFDLIAESDLAGGEVHVISDFRFNEDSTLVDATRRPDNVRVYFSPVYDGDVDNVSIDRVQVPRKLLRPGEVIRVTAAVTNHSRTSTAGFTLEMTVDGSRKAEKVLSLAPSASETVTFPVSFTEWGTYRCRVAKNDDRLPVDDERFFLIEVSQSVPVTIVRGKRNLGDRPGGARGVASTSSPAAGYFYLEKALNPRGTGDAEFVVRTVDEKDVTSSALPQRGVVVWVNPRQMESRRLALIEQYVRRGGGLLLFLGGGDRALWQDRGFRNFIGMKGATEKSSDTQSGYTSFQKDHPVFAIFNREELELLTRTRATSYVSATGVAPDSILAYMGNGDPAIWECSRGAGRVLVFAAAPDLESGDIPLSPMFLPLVHTTVSYLASAGTARRQQEHLVGKQLYFDAAVSSHPLVIRDPAGALIQPVMFESPQGDPQLICERPQRTGYYRLLSDTTAIAEAAVNLDTRESNTAVNALSGRAPGASIVRTDDDFAANLQAARQGREVFAAFIFMAIAALVAESVLGRRA